MRKSPSFLSPSFLFPFLSLLLLAACNSPTSPTGASPVIHTMVVPTQPSCSTVASEPTPGPDTPSLFPPVSETDHVRGAGNPIVTIVEYVDYQDHMSGLFEKEANRLLETHPDELQIVSRLFPALKTNDKAALAAQAAEAAAQQDRFWEMHDLLYAQQQNWASMSAQDFEHWLTAQASTLGMDVGQFQTDLRREDIVAGIQQAWESGQKIGMPVTPIILINGQIYSGPLDYTSLNEIIELIALGKRQFPSCPPVIVQTDKEYIATLHTEKGDVVIQLFADKAPLTVNSFLFLAKSGWYDNITFHQVIPDVFAGTGDPSGTGRGNPGYYMITEIHPSLTFDKPGMVAMANAGPDASGSQFFITYAATPQYDGQYTIFGQVLSGMDVLKQLTARDPQPGIELPLGDKLINITVEEK